MTKHTFPYRLSIWAGAVLLTALACQTISGGFATATPSPIPATPSPTGTATLVPTPAPPTPTPNLTPQPTPIVCSNDHCLDQCLDRLDSVLQLDTFTPLDPIYGKNHISQNLVVYDVQGGNLVNAQPLYVPDAYKKYQEDTATQLMLWSYASSLLPPEQLRWIKQYIVFTDGAGNKLAWVQPKNQDDRQWTLGIDMADSTDAWDLTDTLVHEFGHLITLNNDQIPQTGFGYNWDQNPGMCDQLLTPDGCTAPKSYINLFYQRFWKSILNDWIKNVVEAPAKTQEEEDALVQAFYERHSDQFLRDYSATNIYEDMADSFALFVMNPKPTRKGVVFSKVRFYYEFPELVTLRSHIIQNICAYTRPSP